MYYVEYQSYFVFLGTHKKDRPHSQFLGNSLALSLWKSSFKPWGWHLVIYCRSRHQVASEGWKRGFSPWENRAEPTNLVNCCREGRKKWLSHRSNYSMTPNTKVFDFPQTKLRQIRSLLTRDRICLLFLHLNETLLAKWYWNVIWHLSGWLEGELVVFTPFPQYNASRPRTVLLG